MTVLERPSVRTKFDSGRTPVVRPSLTNRLSTDLHLGASNLRGNSAADALDAFGEVEGYFQTPVSSNRDWLRSPLASIAGVGLLLGPTGTCSPFSGQAPLLSNIETMQRSNADISLGVLPTGRAAQSLVDVVVDEAPVGAIRSSSAAADAVESLKVLLGLTDTEVAELAGFSRRTLTNWRNGANSYSASSRSLFSIDAFVSRLASNLGEAGMRVWLALDDGTGRSRLQALGHSEDSMRNVMTSAEGILFDSQRAVAKADIMHGYSEAEMSALIAGQPRGVRNDGGAPVRPRNPE